MHEAIPALATFACLCVAALIGAWGIVQLLDMVTF